ncbi:MAG: hypothetical protein IJS08_02195 [Victivallales bacterium]|nr:hypothetical protein [Victivallales bacterium]
MMKLTLNFLALVCLCAFWCACHVNGDEWENAGRQEILLNKVGDWVNDSNKLFSDEKDGEFSVRHMVHFLCSHTIKIMPGRKYSFTAEVAADEELKNAVACGFIVSTALHEKINGKHFNYMPDSLMELVAPTTEKQDFILVKSHPKWKQFCKYGFNLVAFNAKADCSDLPNMEISSPIKSITEEGDNLKITFEKKLYAKYPAGTAVRIHRSNLFYFQLNQAKPKQQWQTVGGAFEFPAKAEYFYPCLIYYGPKDKVVRFRNMRLVVE